MLLTSKVDRRQWCPLPFNFFKMFLPYIICVKLIFCSATHFDTFKGYVLVEICILQPFGNKNTEIQCSFILFFEDIEICLQMNGILSISFCKYVQFFNLVLFLHILMHIHIFVPKNFICVVITNPVPVLYFFMYIVSSWHYLTMSVSAQLHRVRTGTFTFLLLHIQSCSLNNFLFDVTHGIFFINMLFIIIFCVICFNILLNISIGFFVATTIIVFKNTFYNFVTIYA